jgi:hypothetical protein
MPVWKCIWISTKVAVRLIECLELIMAQQTF